MLSRASRPDVPRPLICAVAGSGLDERAFQRPRLQQLTTADARVCI